MEQEWTYKALDKIRQEYQIDGQWITREHTAGLDGQVMFRIDNQQIVYNVEIKNEVRDHQLAQLQHLAGKHKPLMVIAKRIFPKLKEFLRGKQIAYLEGNGNIYLQHGKTLIWIDANKPLENEKETVNKAFTKTGLRLIFEIIRNEAAINLTYRMLAEKAKIALGNVNNIMNALKDQGYLLKTNKAEWRLMKKKELLEKWVAAFPEKLKPVLAVGKFRFLNTDDFQNWQSIPIEFRKTCWGGEPAGEYLTHYLKPAILTLYTTEKREELIRNYRLIPDENGKVEIFKKFWDGEDLQPVTAPTILVYTDLLNTGDPRCIETAIKIYDEQLANQF